MWKTENQQLVKNYLFKDFKEALAFMVQVGIIAEKMNHHPHIYNVYNQVKLSLTTHDAGNTITEKDHQLAAEIDKIMHG